MKRNLRKKVVRRDLGWITNLDTGERFRATVDVIETRLGPGMTRSWSESGSLMDASLDERLTGKRDLAILMAVMAEVYRDNHSAVTAKDLAEEFKVPVSRIYEATTRLVEAGYLIRREHRGQIRWDVDELLCWKGDLKLRAARRARRLGIAVKMEAA